MVFTGVGKQKPAMVVISGQESNLICTPISAKSLLVLMADKSIEELVHIAENAKNQIKEVLANEQKV